MEIARAETVISSNDEDKKAKPHLMNLNEDPMLSGVLRHVLSNGNTTFGRSDNKNPPTVALSGLKYVPLYNVLQ